MPFKSFERVLIVDDDPLQRQLLRAVFESFGSVTVSEADSGVTAKHAIETADVPFELIVLDLSMPEMDGSEFMDYLKHASTSSELLLMTGLPKNVIDMAHTLARGQGLNFAGQLQKPISRISVIRTLEKAYATKSAHQTYA